ncbi:MAG: GNAT family N-acetyltransferase [Actinomycetota bacterium]|nr:GNAT family N-acetyltransferase [Actinomycetota bacterium]
MSEELVIQTQDLMLYTVLPDEYLLLEKDFAHPSLWTKRGFSDPTKYFLNNKNPISHRLKLIKDNPDWAKYLLRVAVLNKSQAIIGSVGFHSAPDQTGMIEIGFGVDHGYENRGYGQQILHGMWSWVVNDPLVKLLRYTVSPNNLKSQHIINKLNFNLVGEQIDKEDGLEQIYELTASEYNANFHSNLSPNPNPIY